MTVPPLSAATLAFAKITCSIIALEIPIALIGYAALSVERQTTRLTPQSIAFRGGTDGSALSQRGLPCPNLSAGYENAHGRFEYVPIPSMEKNVEILLRLAARFAADDA